MANQVQQQVQQPQRTEPTGLDPHRPADLRQRPLTTCVPLDGQEEVHSGKQIIVTWIASLLSAAVHNGERYPSVRSPVGS
jgi:hypothetical protein